jgi:hypothetical protein
METTPIETIQQPQNFHFGTFNRPPFKQPPNSVEPYSVVQFGENNRPGEMSYFNDSGKHYTVDEGAAFRKFDEDGRNILSGMLNPQSRDWNKLHYNNQDARYRPGVVGAAAYKFPVRLPDQQLLPEHVTPIQNIQHTPHATYDATRMGMAKRPTINQSEIQTKYINETPTKTIFHPSSKAEVATQYQPSITQQFGEFKKPEKFLRDSEISQSGFTPLTSYNRGDVNLFISNPTKMRETPIQPNFSSNYKHTEFQSNENQTSFSQNTVLNKNKLFGNVNPSSAAEHLNFGGSSKPLGRMIMKNEKLNPGLDPRSLSDFDPGFESMAKPDLTKILKDSMPSIPAMIQPDFSSTLTHRAEQGMPYQKQSKKMKPFIPKPDIVIPNNIRVMPNIGKELL